MQSCEKLRWPFLWKELRRIQAVIRDPVLQKLDSL